MEIPSSNPKPFSLDERQQKIYKDIFDLVGQGPASFFYDACKMMANPEEFKSTAHLVCHLLREIESSLRAILKPIAVDTAGDSQCVEKGISHKEEINQILKVLEIDNKCKAAEAWYELADTLNVFAHRQGLEEPRAVDEIHDLWEKAQQMLLTILDEIREKCFLRWVPIVDELLKKKKPTKRDIKMLANNIPNNIFILHYFFKNLKSPEWLEPLREKGFFKHPPQLNYWPILQYLVRMTEYKPNQVLEIVKEMPETDNVAVWSDLVEVFLRLPPDLSVQFADKVKKWIESKLFSLVRHNSLEQLGELINKWAKGKKVDEALNLASVLFDVLPNTEHKETLKSDLLSEPQARMDAWAYNKILKKYYLIVVEEVGFPAFKLLCDLLEKAIKLSRKNENYEMPNFYLEIFYQEIKDVGTHSIQPTMEALICGVRDAAEKIIRSRKATVNDVVSALESRQWKVFKRIALHILHVFYNSEEFADQAFPLISKRLTDRTLFDDGWICFEYLKLLEKCFPKLNETEKATILNWIKTGPDVKVITGPDVKVIKERHQKLGESPTEEEIIRHKELWQYKRLAYIGSNNLPCEWKAKLQEFEEKNGKLKPKMCGRNFREPTSPKIEGKFQKLPVGKIVEYLKTGGPSENILAKPSNEQLRLELSSAIAEEPDRFAKEASKFKGLDPIFVRCFLLELKQSLKNKRGFEWDSVLDLFQWVLTQPRGIKGRRAKHANTDWRETRKAIAELLYDGFYDAPDSIPFEMRRKAWKIIKPLTNDPDPTPEAEEQSRGNNMDPQTLSMNTTRGVAMHAVIGYALWVRRNLQKQADADEQIRRGFEEMPEVRKILELHLDISREPSLDVRSVYGWRFPELVLLDSKWAQDNAPQIFPIGKGQEAFFEAAWNTYIIFSHFDRAYYFEAIDILYEQYRHAVERIGCRYIDTRWCADPDEKLAENLMLFYAYGKVSLEDPLLVVFWEKASDTLRAHALSFVCQVLKNEEIPAEILDRLKQLWEFRIAQAKESPHNSIKEMSAFGNWFTSGKFETDWAISQLLESLRLVHEVGAEKVPEYLKRYNQILGHLVGTVEEHPEKSVECLEIITKDERDWLLFNDNCKKQIRKILAVAMQKPNTMEKAKRIINYLGSRGFLEFRDLL